MPETFAQRYCRRHGIDGSRYSRVVLRQSLYPLARWLAPVLRFSDSDYFAADNDFINGVGHIMHRREFGVEADEFAHHPANRGFLRLRLRLRVSARRLHRLVVAEFEAAHQESAVTPPHSTGPF